MDELRRKIRGGEGGEEKEMTTVIQQKNKKINTSYY
jgi:hypothetical protein